MAGNNNRGFLGNLSGRVTDRIAWGPNRDPNTGRVYVTPAQVAGGVGSRVLNTVVPGLGTLFNILGNRYYTNRHPGWVDKESVGMPDPTEVSVSTLGGKPDTRSGTTGPSNGNLGFPSGSAPAPGQLYRDPYMGWTPYMAPQGSVSNFGNNNIATQPTQNTWQPRSGWGRDMLSGGTAGPTGAGRGFGNSHFSSGRGGAQTVDAGAAGDITSWLGGGGRDTTVFSRAIK